MKNQFHKKSSRLILTISSLSVVACSDSTSEQGSQAIDNDHPEKSFVTDQAITHAAIPNEISFNDHVRPIFNKNCTGCHGGVNVGKESKLPGDISLIYQLTDVVGKSGNQAIVAGKPEDSELFKRIITHNEDDLMPPAEHGPRLKDEEVAIIKKWIEQGAEWDVHWAYKAPEAKQAPETKLTWGNNKIDAFILSKMEEQGLKPAHTAQPATLLRRLSFDLTGLPPSIENLDRFEKAYAADSKKAYETEVDRLLASEEYGERWASVWMDLARYADSEGLGADRPRAVWPYRDWLIQAFNDDMRFDQFTIRQLAGDQLEKPTHSDLVATTFHRLTQANEEGGTDDEEFRVAAVIDRVNTTWEVWQGQTFGCVQCHSHPYDTINYKEYYKFLSFFNNDKDQDLSNHYPTLKVPNSVKEYAEANAKLKEWHKASDDYISPAQQLAKQSKWLPTQNATLSSTKSKSEIKKANKQEEIRIVGNKVNGTNLKLNWKPTTKKLEAIRLTILPLNEKEALNHPEDGAVLSNVALILKKNDGTQTNIPIEHLIPDESESSLNFRDSLNGNSNGWGPFSKMSHPRWLVIIPSGDVMLDDVESITVSMTYKKSYLSGLVLVPMRSQIEYTDNPRWTGWKYGAAYKLKAYDEAKNAYAKISGPSIPIMQAIKPELARNTFVYDRGNWLETGEQIQKSDTPKSLPKLEARDPNNPTRLDMARWIGNEKNPLTARIAVNRYWQQLFGYGIVETLEDFGSSGSAPTHPDLLDDLAVRFYRDFKWSNKALLKEIVMSATYQQTAAVPREHRAMDAENRWLSYSPRRRLRAEAIRDMGLANSGLLTQQLFGKPTYPPLPPGVWKPFYAADKWVTPAVGHPQRYRRSLYTYWKRSIPYPALMSFDTPTREVCSKRRLVSNTPTAALTTLNDETYAEFSMGLARRMKYEYTEKYGEGSVRDRLAYGYRITTSERPDDETLDELEAAFKTAEQNYKDHPDQLKGIAGTPDGAAYTILGSLLLNLDASLTK